MCITLVRDKYTVRLHGAPCSSLDGVTACVVYTADSIRDSIRTQKNDSQVPKIYIGLEGVKEVVENMSRAVQIGLFMSRVLCLDSYRVVEYCT